MTLYMHEDVVISLKDTWSGAAAFTQTLIIASAGRDLRNVHIAAQRWHLCMQEPIMLWVPDVRKSYLERTKNQAKCMHVFDWSTVVHMECHAGCCGVTAVSFL